jgi:hypothetical protein
LVESEPEKKEPSLMQSRIEDTKREHGSLANAGKAVTNSSFDEYMAKQMAKWGRSSSVKKEAVSVH